MARRFVTPLLIVGGLLLAAAWGFGALIPTGNWDPYQLNNYLLSLRPLLACAGWLCFALALLLSDAPGDRRGRRLAFALGIAAVGVAPLLWIRFGSGAETAWQAYQRQQMSEPPRSRLARPVAAAASAQSHGPSIFPASPPVPSSRTPCPSRRCADSNEICDLDGAPVQPEYPSLAAPSDVASLLVTSRDGLCHQLCLPQQPCSGDEVCRVRDLGTDTQVRLVGMCAWGDHAAQ